MKLAELKVTEFLDKTAGNDPVPGGGSVSALCGAIAAALTGMVAGLTVGRKKYEEYEALMTRIVKLAEEFRIGFVKDIDLDSDAYNVVFEAFKMPKETDEQKALRSARIQEATKTAAEVPMEVARKAREMMDLIFDVAAYGNQNAVTDACVAMMTARTAVLGALLNVRINLTSLKDEEYVARMSEQADTLEKEAVNAEQLLFERVSKELRQ